jgi:hypothetical protein
MEKMIRILAVILGGMVVFLWFIFTSIKPGPVQWVTFQGEGFTCRVPAGPHSRAEENGWHKNIFAHGRFYLSTRPAEGDAEDQIASYRHYLHPAYEAAIPVFDNGRFFLEKKGKFRRYVYLFTSGGKFFWMENSIGGSTLRTYKDILDEVVASLNVDGRSVSPEFQVRTKKINEAIRWYSQSEDLLLTLMLGIPVAIILVVSLTILPFIGKLPNFRTKRPIRTASNLFAWVRRPGRINGTLTALALFEDRLVVYLWRRPFMTITPHDGTVAAIAGKGSIVLREGNKRATVDVDYPLRWLSELSARGFQVARN